MNSVRLLTRPLIFVLPMGVASFGMLNAIFAGPGASQMVPPSVGVISERDSAKPPTAKGILLPEMIRAVSDVGQTRAIAQRDRRDDDSGGGAPAVPADLKPGSPDEAVFHFCRWLADDNTAAASDYVSSTAKGLIGQMRDGDLSEERIEEMVSFFTPWKDLSPTKESSGNGTRRGLRNGKNQTMVFTLRKEKDVYRISELTYTRPKK